MMALQMDKITEISIVIPNDEKWKLFDPTNAEVISNINALMTILKNPKVSNVIGKDIIWRIGRILAFSTAKIKLATNAIHMLDT